MRTVLLSGITGLAIGVAATTTAAVLLWPETSPPSQLRPLELNPDTSATQSGNLIFDTIGLRCGITTIIGTHGEHRAKGRLCRVRITITSKDSVFGQVDNNLQQLTLDNGKALSIDRIATQVKRQPITTEVAAHGQITYDLWFDTPRGSRPTGLRVRANDKEPPVTIPLPERDWTEGSA
ncbi:hypothetical protein GCM10020367_15660 [Streptomyces sannanensis]|uniref:DUF4352 domain-containing protein n=1 Tax=Streptomyces sannanensis TaxID=285536 RepID=A0ABP6S7S5_9ACTN